MKEGNEIWPVAISHKTDGVGEQWPQAVPHKSVYLSQFQKESQGIQPNLGSDCSESEALLRWLV